MAKAGVLTVQGKKFSVQKVSPRWYYGLSDRHLINGKRNTAAYVDELLKNTITDPAEIKVDGLEYFGDDDLGLVDELVTEIESFLKSGG
ncbi:MAG: hypothetical protein ACRDBO_10825 [Lachnospiraceae bacterium]